jgi:hypothetical protein
MTLADGVIARLLDDVGRARALVAELDGGLERWRSTSTALLLPPWLGVVRPLRRVLSEALAMPVGEVATTLAGAAGLRFVHRREALFRELGVTITRARVARFDACVDRVSATLEDGSLLEARAAIVACGGFVAGGLEIPRAASEKEISPSRRTRPTLAFESPQLVVGADGRELLTEGSRYGFSTDELFASLRAPGLLEKIGVLADDALALISAPEVPVRIIGDARANGPRTVGAALREGTRAAKALLPS